MTPSPILRTTAAVAVALLGVVAVALVGTLAEIGLAERANNRAHSATAEAPGARTADAHGTGVDWPSGQG